MKTRIVFCILLLSATTIASTQGSDLDGSNKTQVHVDSLAAKLANGDIEAVEILRIPAHVLTRTAITPEMIEKQFHYKLTIRHIGAYRKELAAALKSTKVELEPGMPDIRWGMIFYDAQDRRMGAVYFDKKGRYGAVGDIPVSFKGELFKWLNRSFSECFR
jgi:hypothetical protein